MSNDAECNISRLEKDNIQANTKHLYNICRTSNQRNRRCSNIPHMLFKCFVFTVIELKGSHSRYRILVQVTIYRRLLIGRDGHLDQSEAYDIS